MSLSRDDILGADDLPRREVPVPEWGGSVFIRAMTGTDRDRYEAFLINSNKKKDHAGHRALIVSMVVVDEDGVPLFRPKDIEPLGRKSADALDRVMKAALELSGMDDASVDDAEKNSDGGTSGDSGSS